MSSALLTTGQARWGTHVALILLSAVSIATSAPSSLGGMTFAHITIRVADLRGDHVEYETRGYPRSAALDWGMYTRLVDMPVS